MRWSACNCRAENYQRVQRQWWMRPVWNRRLYHCQACGEALFIAPTEVLFRRAEEKAMHVETGTAAAAG